ncbi:hypothetical protein BDV10DRAFT_188934 [Aspergillus recurvatus]
MFAPENCFRRAKLLFFFGIERDPSIQVVSAILLHWYHPVGPATLATDTGGFWLYATASALQSGRRRTIYLSDSDVASPSRDGFLKPDAHARIFLVTVSIGQPLDAAVERCLSGGLAPAYKRSLENWLFRWIQQDSPSVNGLFPGNSMEARQVVVTYLANLIILERFPSGLYWPPRSLSASSVSFWKVMTFVV